MAALGALAPRLSHARARLEDLVPRARWVEFIAGRSLDLIQGYIQQALDAGVRHISIGPITCPLVQRGVKNVGRVRIPYCLEIGANTHLDLDGATLALADGQRAAALVNRFPDRGTDANIVIENGVIRGARYSSPVSPRDLEYGCLILYGVRASAARNLLVIDAQQYAGRFLRCADCSFESLICKSSRGDGWSFGLSANQQVVENSSIDDVFAENCQGNEWLAGNGAIFTVVGSRIGTVRTVNCAGGIKLQDASRDCVVRRLEFVGGSYGTANSGVKIQGNVAVGLMPQRIAIDEVSATDCFGEGLAVRFADDIAVGTYSGVGNSNGLKNRDVDLRAKSVSIGKVNSRGCHGAVVSIGAPGRYKIEAIQASDQLGSALQVAAAASVVVGEIALDGPSLAGLPDIHVSSPQALGYIDSLVVSPGRRELQVKNASRSFRVDHRSSEKQGAINVGRIKEGLLERA